MPETPIHVASGKVRELYALDDERLLLVASDRISTFDVVLPTEIPDKGRVLTGLSAFWFARTREICPEPPARAARRTAARPSAGGSRCCRSSASSAATSPARAGRTTWRPARSAGTRCRTGLRESDRLPEPIFTPATKADDGPRREHRRDAGGRARRRRSASTRSSGSSLALYRFAAEHAAARGILIADTKFEFGLDADGRLVLADEAFTPDSSRFWPADEYEPGGPQPSFDKQFVRDYCETLGWDKTAAGPGAARRRRRRHARALRRGVRAADRDRVRRLPRRPGGGAAMRATVLVRPEAGHPRPAGRGGARARCASSASPSARRASAAWSTSRSTRPTPTQARAEVERMCEQLLANPLIESYEIEIEADRERARPRSRSSSSPARTTTGRRLRALERARRRRRRSSGTPRSELPRRRRRRPARRLLVRRLPPLRRDRPLRAGDGARSRAFAAERRARARDLQRLPDPLRGRPAAGRAAAERVALVRLPRRRRCASSARTRRSRRAASPASGSSIPVKHGEGCWFADAGAARRARGERPDRSSATRARTRTARSATSPASSTRRGNVMGLMPHPEHAVDPLLGSDDGALDPRLARRRRAPSGCSSRRPRQPERLGQRRAARPALHAAARGRALRSVTGPRRADAVRRVGEAHEPLAAWRLEQLDDGGEPLLARPLRQRQLLDQLRRSPRCRRFRHLQATVAAHL